jgi:hypothetical protein
VKGTGAPCADVTVLMPIHSHHQLSTTIKPPRAHVHLLLHLCALVRVHLCLFTLLFVSFLVLQGVSKEGAAMEWPRAAVPM